MDISASRLTALTNKWPGLTSLVLGLFAALAYPPLHMWPIGFAALAVFVWHLHRAPTWQSALFRGWLFGWAHLTLANNWIATAFTYQGKMPEVLGWIAVPLLCVYLAVYPALAAVTAHLAGRRSSPLAFGVLFAAAWIVTEWMRGWVFTGYPWPPLGLMLLGGWGNPGLAALAPWMGTYGLSGLTMLLASLLVWAVRRRAVFAGAAWLAIVGTAMIAPWASLLDQRETDIAYTLVQPNITQDEINDASQFESQFIRLAEPTMVNRDQSRLVLWPEGTIPDYLEDGYPQLYYTRMTANGDPEYARERLGRVIGPQSTLLIGVVNLDIGTREDGSQGAVTARNSVMALDGEGSINEHYAKSHLVPYGEYLPLKWLLEPLGLARLSEGGIPYDPGPGPRTLDLGVHGRAGVQICYEIVFSGHVVDRSDRPDYIFNPSNDGWFGLWGPPQHLAQARLRAIEEGLPVLRATTTGISAVIDANGVVRQHIPSGENTMIEGHVPVAHPPTLFAQLGNVLPLVLALFLGLLAFALPRLLALRAPES